MPVVKVTGLADSDGEVFPTLPAATYNVRVKTVEIVESKSHEGRENFKVSLTVTQEHPEHVGHNLMLYLPIPAEDMDATKVQQATARIKNFTVACGLDANNDELDTDDFLGEELRVVVTEKEEENPETGEMRKSNSIRDTLPA